MSRGTVSQKTIPPHLFGVRVKTRPLDGGSADEAEGKVAPQRKVMRGGDKPVYSG